METLYEPKGHVWKINRFNEMKQITSSNELRQIQMDILSYVDGVCRKYDIKYSISGGTLIGAVRHKGFIPWDDDIDIMLARSEYDRLVEVMTNEYNNGNRRYRIITHNLDNDYLFPYAKVFDEKTLLIEHVRGCKNFGVFVDVFPIDNVENQSMAKTFPKMRVLYNMLTMKRLIWEKQRPLYKNLAIILSRLILLPFSNHWIISRMEQLAKKCSDSKTDKMACLVWGYGRREVVPTYIHSEHIYLPFENREYMAIKEYGVYLSTLFGDYMKLPPEDKQVTHHDFEAYWKD